MDAPPTVPVVRLAGADDVDELIRLRALMHELLGFPNDEDGPRRGWRTAAADYLRRGFAAGTAAAAVAEAPGRPGRLVAGGAITLWQRLPGPGTPDGRYGYVSSMVTEPAWQGRGLARRVVAELLAWAQAQGVAKVDLHASPAGEPLYRSLGFARRDAFPEMAWRAPASGA